MGIYQRLQLKGQGNNMDRPRDVVLSGACQAEKDKCHMVSLISEI